jgi:DNA invertase Pin-like site-specific DNA recombinase
VSETRLVGYARVSTEDQNLEMQTAALKRAGVLDDNIHVDKASGVSKRRPGLRMALMDCREGDTLVVWKLDRLTRSPPELYALVDRLKDKGVGLRSLTEMLDTTTAIGRLVMGITTAVAGFERDLIAERTKAGLAAIRERREEEGEEWDWGRKPSLTEAQVVKAGEWLNREKNPMSGPQIAERYGVSAATIYKHYKVNKSGRGPRFIRKTKP